jgi:hypothetical protein
MKMINQNDGFAGGHEFAYNLVLNTALYLEWMVDFVRNKISPPGVFLR